jgi:hypothetical protein
MHDDDKMMSDVSAFDGQDVVVTEKMDGECTTMYTDYIHARSINSGSHTSRDWVKAFHRQICGDIPVGWRVNVENMYAKHAIFYDQLETYAYGFAIWDDKNYTLDWDTTLEWFKLLGITPCPVIYRGIFDKNAIETAYKCASEDHECEGYVVRLVKSFHYKEFRTNVGKYVRKGHIQNAAHWFYGQKVVPNAVKKPC